ncbi:MAG: ribonuclease III [Nitrospirae bacterium]|nr:ribonuclease III [Nitrospirota bacterium]
MPPSSSKDIADFELAIGHSFKKRSLATEALTHKSYSHENKESRQIHNERLEFLGDSVLGLVISEYLFENFRKYPESKLSKLKSYLVKEATLAEAAERLDIGSYLFMGKGEEISGGRNKPSLLANAFEAVIAAIYIDSGMKKARDFILRSLSHNLLEITEDDLLVDFKTLLQEITQAKFGCLPEYLINSEKGPEHEKLFEASVKVNNDMLGKGSGKTKKAAEQMAAKEGLKKIKKS